jgi:hypothetical protein
MMPQECAISDALAFAGKPDSRRMRIRLAALIVELVPVERWFDLRHALRLKQGVQVRGLSGRGLENFTMMQKPEISLTVLLRFLIF